VRRCFGPWPMRPGLDFLASTSGAFPGNAASTVRLKPAQETRLFYRTCPWSVRRVSDAQRRSVPQQCRLAPPWAAVSKRWPRVASRRARRAEDKGYALEGHLIILHGAKSQASFPCLESLLGIDRSGMAEDGRGIRAELRRWLQIHHSRPAGPPFL